MNVRFHSAARCAVALLALALFISGCTGDSAPPAANGNGNGNGNGHATPSDPVAVTAENPDAVENSVVDNNTIDSETNVEDTANSTERDPAEVIGQMSDYYASLDAFSTNVTQAMEMTMPGMSNTASSNVEFRVKRPGQLAMISTEGMTGATLVSDGEHLYTYMSMFNSYTVDDAPESLADITADGALGAAAMFGGGGGMFLPMLLADDIAEKLFEGVSASEYLGVESLEGTDCHVCAFEQEDMDWKIWIATGDQPFIHRIQVDLDKGFKKMAEQMEELGKMYEKAHAEMNFAFADWRANPSLTDDDFVFTPPEGAEESDSLFGNMLGGDDSEEAPHELLGQAAPTFTVENLAGDSVSLDNHLGSDVVVLDFWASWCGPCRSALPLVKAAAESYADQGVVFYAVNVQEDADTINEFMESEEIQLPVILDADGSVSESYGVSGIPQTVIIGLEGDVQVVHVGFSPNLEDELSTELEALLAGEDLAATALTESDDAASDTEEPATDETEEAASDDSEPQQAESEPDSPADEDADEVADDGADKDTAEGTDEDAADEPAAESPPDDSPAPEPEEDE